MFFTIDISVCFSTSEKSYRNERCGGSLHAPFVSPYRIPRLVSDRERSFFDFLDNFFQAREKKYREITREKRGGLGNFVISKPVDQQELGSNRVNIFT